MVNVRSKQTVGSLFNSAGYERTAGTGTGFIWDFDGHVVTNYHVVARATAGVTIAFSDGTTAPATIVVTSEVRGGRRGSEARGGSRLYSPEMTSRV